MSHAVIARVPVRFRVLFIGLRILCLLALAFGLPVARACDSPICQAESADLLLILPNGSETHTAVSSGNWSSASTWQGGIIPTAGAKVLIPAGIDVRYDLNSDVRLDTVRVDGALRFAKDRSIKLVLDTLVVPAKTAVLEIGTPTAPIPPQFTVKIIITGDRRDANGNTAFAPGDLKQFGRGIVSKGKVTMHGAKKDSYLELTGNALAGDNVLTFKKAPSGWQVGDVLVLAGDSTYSAETSVTTDAPVVITGTASTLFGTAAALGGTSSDNNYELGTRFRTSTDGYVTALRVWRPATNGPASYTARLWTATGTKLAQVTIAAPTAGAWAEAPLDSPVALTAGATYVVSYAVAAGQAYQTHNPSTQTAVSSGPLSTLSDGKIGVYVVSSTGAFPTNTYQNSKYYADVRFVVPDPLTPFQTWQENHFTSAQIANSAFAGMNADPDGDGLPNILEYAVDHNPLDADSSAATVVAIEAGTGKLRLTFRRARPELTYQVWGSSNLLDWTQVGPYNPGALGHDVTVTDQPPQGATRRFLRLKVSQPE